MRERLQDADGGAWQACQISYAGSLSILIAGRHSIFVWAPRRMDSNGKFGAETLGRHGGMAWMVMKAALAYATFPRIKSLHARFVNLHYKNNTVHSRLPRANKSWRDCGKNNSPAQPSMLGCQCEHTAVVQPCSIKRA